MRVLIISDTHGRDEPFNKVIARTGRDIDMLVHCGDIEGREEMYRRSLSCPVRMVPGNNDYFSMMPKDVQFEIGDHRVWLTHGHIYRVSLGLEYLKDEARARDVDVVMFGHTHRPVIERDGNLTLLNPGSLTYPRQENRRPSYIVMEIKENGDTDYEIKYL
ncbi:MAG: metallophosphoesterase [Lachnospiraceae bacterium]|nr:metallophosphoesterase [Lachnospiraceae bacterium]